MKKKISRQALVFILITAFLNLMGIGIIIPVIPFMVARYIPGNDVNSIAFYVGLLVSIYAFCQFFAAPGLGMLSDRFGRRPILLISLMGSAIGYVVFGVGGSLLVLFLGRIIDGLTGGNVSTIYAFIADSTEHHDRAKYYGMIGGAMGFGFVVGPALGGLTAKISLSAPLYLAALVTFLNVIWGYFALPESLDTKHRLMKFELQHLNPFAQFGRVYQHAALRTLLFIGFFYFLPFAELQGNGSVIMKDALHFTPANIGFIFFLIGIVDIFVQGYLVQKLVPFFGEIKLITIGLIFVAISFVLYALLPAIPHPATIYMGAIIFAFGSGLVEPSFAGLISHTAKPHEQGLVQGANQSMQSLSRVIGPLLAALLYTLGWSIPYIIAALLIIVALGAIYKIPRKFAYGTRG